MKPRLRLRLHDVSSDPGPRQPASFVFPSKAAAQLTPTAACFSNMNPLPFPLSHPENGVYPDLRSRVSPSRSEASFTSTDDLVGSLFGVIDSLQAGLDTMSETLDSYPFPERDDDDRPFAA